MAAPANHAIRSEHATSQDDETLIARYIKPYPDRPGRAYAYFPDYGYSVARIIRDVKAADGDIATTARHWEMPEDAIRAALAFYHRHHDYIDARILLEDDPYTSNF